MAVLSKNGTELARLEKHSETPEDPDIAKRLNRLAFMSNGWILESSKVWFRDPYTRRRDGLRVHRFGWRRWRRIKKDREVPEAVASLVDRFRKQGWEVAR